MSAIYSTTALETMKKSCEPGQDRLLRTLRVIYKKPDWTLEQFVDSANRGWAEGDEPEREVISEPACRLE